MTNFYIERQKNTAKYYSEDLGNGIKLDMVLIPEGKFIMGAPESEQDSRDSERPQHEVTVPTFFMGRYPVTQEQWRTVAGFPQINLELEADPSRFKGDKRPVEQVNWYQVQEFCNRLSQYTYGKREYRLPSEAEWEYACRAGTTIQFHFGATITTDLANYRGTDKKESRWLGYYGKGPKGEYREKTTIVGKFLPNNFGLWDMHGNVWEWCEDYWHENYQNAPTDGSSWIDGENSSFRILRGGSWYDDPNYCRSSARYYFDPVYGNNDFIGFRVECGVPRIQ